jgi:hypothetical protein
VEGKEFDEVADSGFEVTSFAAGGTGGEFAGVCEAPSEGEGFCLQAVVQKSRPSNKQQKIRDASIKINPWLILLNATQNDQCAMAS